MGFFGFIGSAVSSALSAVGSAISSGVNAIGSALSSFSTGIGVVLGNVISALAPVAQAIGKFANAFLQGLGILKPDEKIEDFGDRALQAAEQGITMDKFENFDDYMNALRDFTPDPEVSAKRSHAEKLVAGMGVGTIGVEDKYNAERGSLNGMWLLPVANPDYFTPDRMQGLVSAGRLGSDIFAYLEKQLAGSEARGFEKSLEIDSDGKSMSAPELDTLYGALGSARENWANLSKQVEAKINPEHGA